MRGRRVKSGLQRRALQPALHRCPRCAARPASSMSQTRVPLARMSSVQRGEAGIERLSSTPTGTSTTGNALGSDPPPPVMRSLPVDGGCNGSIAREAAAVFVGQVGCFARHARWWA